MPIKTDMTKPFIFISYSHIDKDWVFYLVDALEKSGYNIWFDDHSLEIGEEWEKQIKEGIEKCTVFMAILSNDYDISEFCQRELALAKAKAGLRILCIRDTDESVKEDTPVLKEFEKKQFITWDVNDEPASYQKLQQFLNSFDCRKAGHTGAIQFTPLAKLSLEHIERQKNNHPSFRIFENNEADEKLYPKGQLARISSIQEDLSGKGLKEFIEDNWENGEYRHILIRGNGGIGKTVSLLDLFSKKHYAHTGVPVSYIPLHVLPDFESIDKYMENTYSNRLANLLVATSHKPWNKGPRIVLLLDGYNEVPLGKRTKVENLIHTWMIRDGVRILSTSRILFEMHGDKFKTFDLLELDSSIKKHYLGENYAIELSKVITTPFMLKLYTDVDSFIRTKPSELIHFRKANNPGSLIYNYLQRELYKVAILNSGDCNATRRSIDSAFAILCASPCIAWEMAKDNLFTLSHSEFKLLAEKAVTFWHSNQSLPGQMIEAEDYFESEWAEGKERWLVSRQVSILTRKIAFFVKDETTESYSLMHQNFRDALAAIHLLNLMDASMEELLKALSLHISEEVLGFFSDLLTNLQIQELWLANKKTVPLPIQPANAILRLAHTHSNGDLFLLDFSEMDIKELNLYRYRCRKTHAIRLSKNPGFFKNTKLYRKCFQPEGHSDAITCLAMNETKSLLASASSDGTIIIWNMLKNSQYIDPLSFSQAAYSLHFANKDQNLVIQFQDGRILSYKIENGEAKWLEPRKPELSCVTKRENLLAAGFSDGSLEIHGLDHPYDIVTAKVTGHGIPESLELLDSHKLIVKAQEESFLADLHNPSQPMLLDHIKDNAITISSHGDFAYVSQETGCFQKIDMATGNPLQEAIQAFDEPILDMSLYDNESTLVTMSTSMSTRFWTTNGEEKKLYGESFVNALNALLIATEKKEAAIEKHCMEQNNNPIHILEHKNALCVSIATNNRNLVFGTKNGDVILLDTLSSEAKTLYKHKDWVASVAISTNGRHIASASHDCTVHFYDTGKQSQRHLQMKLDCWATTITLSYEGSHVACGCHKNEIRIWHAGKNSFTRHSTSDYCTALAFHPNSQILAIGTLDGEIELFDYEHKESLPISGHQGSVNSLSFSPDGRCLISGSDDMTVRMYDMENKTQSILYQHSDIVTSVMANETGNIIISGSRDKTIHIWNSKTDASEEFPANSDILALAYDPFSSSIVYVDGNGESIVLSSPLIMKEYMRESPRALASSSSKSFYHDMFPKPIHPPMLLSIHGNDMLFSSNDCAIYKADCTPGIFASRLPSIPGTYPTAFFWHQDEDNDFVVIGTQDGRIYLYDNIAMALRVKPTQQASSPIDAFAFDDENDILYCSCKEKLLSWHLGTNEWKQTDTTDTILSLVYDKKNKCLLAGTKDRLLLYSCTPEKGLFLSAALDGYAGTENALATDENGNPIAGTLTHGVCVWKPSFDSERFTRSQLQGNVDKEDISLAGLDFSSAVFVDKSDLPYFTSKGVKIPLPAKKRFFFQ